MSAFTLIVNLKIKLGQVDQFMKMALENAAASRTTEPGCRQFDVLADPEDPTKIAFYEVYDNKQAFESHLETAHFKKYFEHAVPLLAERTRSFFNRVAP